MGETNQSNQTGAGKPSEKAMTAVEAAKLVKRKVVERKPVMAGKEQARDKGGVLRFEEAVREVPVAASEVLAFKDYGSHVVVVTRDGKKFSSGE